MVRSASLIATAAALASCCSALSSGFKGCDALVNAGLGSSLIIPSLDQNSYAAALETYYSVTVREMMPYCILQPKNTKEVAAAVEALTPLSAAGDWHIAVRSGGHGHWGGNNVHGGVTIDLSFLNQTTISTRDRQKIASVGTGARWSSVLAATEKQGLIVTSGRIGTIGVGGFTLGGGLSFTVAEHGWACDGVVNFEVVLADGRIVNANDNENQDLFRALKGGGSNFGIVTRFDLATFASREMYGGIMFMDWAMKDTVANNLIDEIDQSEKDPYNSMMLMYTYNAGAGSPAIGAYAVNTKGDENAIPFRGLDKANFTLDGRSRQTLGEILAAMQDTGGARNVWYTLCFHNNKQMLSKAEELFKGLYEDAEKAFPDGGWSLNFVFQGLPKHVTKFSKGGNVLGLENTLNHNAIIFAGESTVTTRLQESWFNAKQAAIATQLEAYAKNIGSDIPYRYLPYAAAEQDPLGTYGSKNVEYIRQVATLYDPFGFFQTRVNGGYKISRVEYQWGHDGHEHGHEHGH